MQYESVSILHAIQSSVFLQNLETELNASPPGAVKSDWG